MPHVYSKEQALELVHSTEDSLFTCASHLRQKTFGNKVELCAIINARSGHCSMDCTFCSQSIHHNTKTITFELLSQEEILARLNMLAKYPLQRVGLVTSGGVLQDNNLTNIIEILENLPSHWQGKLCASLGKLNSKALARLYKAGLKRYHHNLETSRNYYPKLCTTQTWDERLKTVKRAQEIPLSICCGGIFGLGESWEDRIDFALTLRENNVKHVPINFLHPHAGTPLAKQNILDASEALRIIAIFRHILPTASLRICGGRPLILAKRQEEVFAAGANALMTGNYLTTTGNGIEDDCIMIQEQGLEILA